MLNESKVKLMTRLAIYESKNGERDLKISTYHRKDYISFQTIITILWLTVGYALIVGTIAFSLLETLINDLNLAKIIMLVVAVVTVYLVLVIGYVWGASRFYGKKYDEARKRMTMFNHDLTRLNKMYEREK